MRKLKRFGVLLATTLLLGGLLGFGGGCGSDLVKKLDGLADEACACKDTACAEKVNQKLEDALENAKEPSKDDAEKIMASVMRAGECIAKLQMAGE